MTSAALFRNARPRRAFPFPDRARKVETRAAAFWFNGASGSKREEGGWHGAGAPARGGAGGGVHRGAPGRAARSGRHRARCRLLEVPSAPPVQRDDGHDRARLRVAPPAHRGRPRARGDAAVRSRHRPRGRLRQPANVLGGVRGAVQGAAGALQGKRRVLPAAAAAGAGRARGRAGRLAGGGGRWPGGGRLGGRDRPLGGQGRDARRRAGVDGSHAARRGRLPLA